MKKFIFLLLALCSLCFVQPAGAITVRQQSVAFHPNGASGTVYVDHIPLGSIYSTHIGNCFSRPGWLFLGWALSPSGSIVIDSDGRFLSPNLNTIVLDLYAIWAKKSYKISFKANGGKGKMSSKKMTYGKSAKLPKNKFKRSGWVFLGWAKSASGSVAYKNAASVKNLRSDGKTTKLYAVWAKKSYKVAFYANGGKGKMSSKKMTYGKSAKLPKNKFKRSGYTFKGWAKTKGGAVVYKNAASVKNLTRKGKKVKLYAVWQKKTTSSGGISSSGGGIPVYIPAPWEIGIGSTTTWKVCITCRGIGSCPICKGVGGGSMYGTSWSTCSACGGSGKCWNCHGSGRD